MFYDPKDPAQKGAVQKVVDKMIDRALEMDGTVSGEHAIGIGKTVSFNRHLKCRKSEMLTLYCRPALSTSLDLTPWHL